MPKTTKRARKFIAKGGTAKSALEKKRGAERAKRGKAARRGKKEDDGDGDGEMKKEKERREEEEERERRKNDFVSTDGLGNLDMESFFEKAAGLADDEGSGGSGDDDDEDDGEEDGSVDSFSSLPSEEEDLEASEAAMKATLEKMSEDDPDFHKYLRENESSLLEFEEDDDGDDDGDSEGGEDGDETLQKKSQAQPKAAEDKFLLTPLRLQQLEQGAFGSHSVRGLKRIIAAYRTACHLSDAAGREEADNSSDEEEGGGGGRRKREFQITSPAVFDRLMAVCLAQCHGEFHYHLLGRGSGPGGDDAEGSGSDDDEKEAEKNDDETNEGEDAFDENKPLHPKKLSKSPRFLAIRPLLESFLRSTHHLLAEGGKEAKLLQFVLSSLSKYVPYLSLLPKLAKTLLKTCVRLWSGPSDTSEEHNAVRLRAFLRIRQLAVTQPYPFVEDALKLTYLSYARRSRFGTAANVASVLPTLTFMGNCIVELYSLDYASAYQHAFVYIRQLALHLRTAVMKRTEEAVGVVLCWQYVHCLKLWTAVLSAACAGGSGGGPKGGGKDEEANLLRSLVYPLTEVILGTCRLANTARFVPLRLHCVRLLQQLAASAESFVPTTSILLAVLDAREVGMRPLRDGGRKKGGKKGKGKTSVQGLRLPLILKLPKEATLRTTEQLDGVLREVFVLLNREADLYRYSPGFPEFAFTVAQRLRKFNKGNGNGRWRAYAKGTVELCEKYSKFATEARATLVDAPKDVARLEALRPAGVPSMRERYEAAAAKERRLEAAARPATKKGNDAKAGDEAAAKGGKKKKKAGAKGERKRKGGEEEGANDDDSEEGEEGEEGRKIPKPKKNKKKKVVNEADLKNVEALKEEDEVQEGVEWSDSE